MADTCMFCGETRLKFYMSTQSYLDDEYTWDYFHRLGACDDQSGP